MKWIPVKDQLPPKDKRFLGYGDSLCGNCDDKILEICRYEKNYSNNVFGEWDCAIDIAYWQPLPEKPE